MMPGSFTTVETCSPQPQTPVNHSAVQPHSASSTSQELLPESRINHFLRPFAPSNVPVSKFPDPCYDFFSGKCFRGQHCSRVHVSTKERNRDVCFFYLHGRGTCPEGSECRRYHLKAEDIVHVQWPNIRPPPVSEQRPAPSETHPVRPLGPSNQQQFPIRSALLALSPLHQTPFKGIISQQRPNALPPRFRQQPPPPPPPPYSATTNLISPSHSDELLKNFIVEALQQESRPTSNIMPPPEKPGNVQQTLHELPKRPEQDPRSAEVCLNYLKDRCAWGDRCHRQHPPKGTATEAKPPTPTTQDLSGQTARKGAPQADPSLQLAVQYPHDSPARNVPTTNQPPISTQAQPLQTPHFNNNSPPSYSPPHDPAVTVTPLPHDQVHAQVRLPVRAPPPVQHTGLAQHNLRQDTFRPQLYTVDYLTPTPKFQRPLVDSSQRDAPPHLFKGNNGPFGGHTAIVFGGGQFDHAGTATSAERDNSGRIRSAPQVPLPRGIRLPDGVCFEWARGRCFRDTCKFRHQINEESAPSTVSEATQPSIPSSERAQPPARATCSSAPDRVARPYSPRSSAPGSSTGVVPPARPPPPETVTIPVHDYMRVVLGPGFDVRSVRTGTESNWVALSNVPADVSQSELERVLTPFGKPVEVRLREKAVRPSASYSAVVQMEEASQVSAVVEALDGVEIFGARIHAQVSLGRQRYHNQLRNQAIHISWEVPLSTGYAGYDTLEEAQKAVTLADGFTMRKQYWVTASLYEGIPVVGAYNVRFTGLPPDVQGKDLAPFGKTDNTMFERPIAPLANFGIPAVQRLLSELGPMSSFENSPAPYKNGLVRAWALFETPDVANEACRRNGIKQKALGYQRITVQRVQSVLYEVPRDIYSLISEELQALRSSLWQNGPGTHIHVFNKNPGMDSVQLKLVAEDSVTIRRLKADIEVMVRGEPVEQDGKKVWDPFFSRPDGQAFLENTEARHRGLLVRADRLRRTIRLIGRPEKRALAQKAIITKFNTLTSQKVFSIPLDGHVLTLVMRGAFNAFSKKQGVETTWMDISQRKLFVRGSAKGFHEVQAIVQRDMGLHTTSPAQAHCPVCFELATDPVTLDCGHSWCKACLEGYLTAASDVQSFPLRCLGDEGKCSHLIPTFVARRVLPPSGFDTLVQAAFSSYIHTRPDDFYHCPTPDCPQVYRSGPRDSVISCPSCICAICPHCHVEYHEGVTCADREDGLDKLFEEWTSLHDVKKCPGCKVPIERSEGCNHMTCTRCHTHTCWVCLETFPQGKGIYDHMRSAHGSIGV